MLFVDWRQQSVADNTDNSTHNGDRTTFTFAKRQTGSVTATEGFVAGESYV